MNYSSQIQGSFCGAMAKSLNCNIVDSEFELQLRYYIHFWNALGKGINPPVLFFYGLNSTAIVLQGWLWY